MSFRRRTFVFDDLAKQSFLEQIAEHGMITTAARHIGTITRRVDEELRLDDEFREAFEDALLAYNDKIAGEIHRRAIEGVPKGVYFQGVRVDEELVYSDNLLLAHAKANIEKYRDRSKQEVTITGGVLIAPAPAATAAAWLEDNSPKAHLPAPTRDESEDHDERIIDIAASPEPLPV